MKLFTIGDSISQGFMSFAAARTELSYSTLIARVLGLTPEVDYPLPTWHEGGLPLNLERLLRRLQSLYGADIRGLLEWPRALLTINGLVDDVEDHYERGSGNIARPQAGPTKAFPNSSCFGFTVADAWLLDPNWCLQQIRDGDEDDGLVSLPNKSLARAAHAVLNPSRHPAYGDRSQLKALEQHVKEEGVENLLLWLGSNNALGTVTRLKLNETPNDPNQRMHVRSVQERDSYNLWHPDDFKAEYEELLNQVSTLMGQNKHQDWRVFIGNVPAVSIAPLCKGIGAEKECEDPFGVLGNKARYFENYTYVIFGSDFARRTGLGLTRDQVLKIDGYISEYNKIIANLIQAANGRLGKERYFLVDISSCLLKLAYRRNNGQPTYPLPPELARARYKPNTMYYHADRNGQMQQGGFVSLDGVHPSAIGQGVLALEFLKVMEAAGAPGAKASALDWNAIIASDTLYTNPIALMGELYDNSRLAEFLVDVMRRVDNM